MVSKFLSITLVLGLASSIKAQQIIRKPDFIQKDADGEVLRRGVYTTNDSGYVIRYDLFDGEGTLV